MIDNKQAIHETVLLDIVNAIMNGNISDKLGDLPSTIVNNIMNRRNNIGSYSSIAKATSNLVLTFPVIVDESVSLSTALKISKATERKAVMMLQMLFAALSAQAQSSGKDAFDYVKKVHSNLNSDDLEDYIQQMELYGRDHQESTNIDEKTMKMIQEDNRLIDSYTLSKRIIPSLEESFFVEANGNVKEKKDSNDDKQPGLNDIPSIQYSSEIKKANEMAPTLMVIHFRTQGADGRVTEAENKAVIGVKAKLQFVTSDDVVDRIIDKNRDGHGLFNFLRATTREISFLKDFLFAIDKAKLDATHRSSSPIWKILERRAANSSINTMIGRNNDAAAITTLVISRDTLDTLNKEYGFRGSVSDILGLMKAYNLLAFFIADDVRERVDFIYDDDSRKFETLSYSALDKAGDSDLKKVISVLTATR